jgi:GR25 family glycosyltransferase involved in LPS biosynthesis
LGARLSFRQLSLQEISCALNHKGIIELQSIYNQDWTLVLEDDSIIDSSRLKKLLDTLPIFESPTVLHLGSFNDENLTPHPFPVYTAQKRLLVIQDEIFHRTVIPPNGGFGYLINLAAAELAKKYASHKKLASEADFPIFWRNRVNFYILERSIVWYQNEGSLIQSERFVRESKRLKSLKYRHSGIRRLLYVFDLLGLTSLIAQMLGIGFFTFYFDKVVVRERYRSFLRRRRSFK